MSDDEELSVYDEVEIEDMTYDEALQTYFYPCPCGDQFQIALADLQDEETDIAVCPSCSLMIRVIYEVVSPVLTPHIPMPEPAPLPSGERRLRRGCQQYGLEVSHPPFSQCNLCHVYNDACVRVRCIS